MNPNAHKVPSCPDREPHYAVIAPYAFSPRRDLHPPRPLNYQGNREAAHQLRKRR